MTKGTRTSRQVYKRPIQTVHALVTVRTVDHQLAGDEVDGAVGADLALDVGGVEVLVEDHAVLKDLDERRALVGGGRGEGLIWIDSTIAVAALAISFLLAEILGIVEEL